MLLYYMLDNIQHFIWNHRKKKVNCVVERQPSENAYRMQLFLWEFISLRFDFERKTEIMERPTTTKENSNEFIFIY